MADIISSLVILVCAILDFVSTKSVVSKLGISAELNPLIRFLMQKLGIVPGLLTGIFIPTIVILVTGCTLNLTEMLYFIAGARSTLAVLQIVRKKTFGF